MAARSMRILVTGGAGYVGSHVCKALARRGHEPVVLDNLVSGRREAVRWGPLHVGDLRDAERLDELARSLRPDAVIHLAALANVGESMADPLAYYDNNVSGTTNLLKAVRAAGIPHFVLSSSCAVYGLPDALPVTESAPTRPVSPYGETKLACERQLHWSERAFGMRWTALRYFNAAGADPEGELDDTSGRAGRLIPLAIAAALGDDRLTVHGSDYPTRDGTAVRDYVHVWDIALAHVTAVERLADGGASTVLNLGSGQGYSVSQIIDAVGRASGGPVPYVMSGRRPGDPAALWADTSAAKRQIGYVPRFSSLERIVGSAWDSAIRARGTGTFPAPGHKAASH